MKSISPKWFAGRKQGGAIQKGPAVKLHVRQLDSLRTQRFRQTNQLRQAIDVKARKELTRVKVGNGPWGVTVGPRL
jgi:hypothetical protein